MEALGIIELTLGVLIAAVGWWVSVLTDRIVSLSERLSRLEGRQSERDNTSKYQ